MYKKHERIICDMFNLMSRTVSYRRNRRTWLCESSFDTYKLNMIMNNYKV